MMRLSIDQLDNAPEPPAASHGRPRKARPLAHHTLIAAALAEATSASLDHVHAALAEVA